MIYWTQLVYDTIFKIIIPTSGMSHKIKDNIKAEKLSHLPSKIFYYRKKYKFF